MEFRCCDSTFKSEGEFKKHLGSRRRHYNVDSANISIEVQKGTIMNVLTSPRLLFGLMGNIVLSQEIGCQRPGYLMSGENVISVKVEEPFLEAGMIGYRINLQDQKVQYDISFKTSNLPGRSNITALVKMIVDIGRIGRIMPGQVIKALSNNVITPGKLIREFIEPAMKALEKLSESGRKEEVEAQ